MAYAYTKITFSPSRQIDADVYERTERSSKYASTGAKGQPLKWYDENNQEIVFKHNSQDLISNTKDNGQLSPPARAKLSNAVHNLRAISKTKSVYESKTKKYFKFRLVFITLTLPSVQVHPDQFLTDKMLDVFLKWCYNKHKMNSYVWKAEAQSNGNLHFHITTNIFIHWKAVREKWNSLLNKYGYIDAFEKEHNHRDPNSTDVHSVKNDKEIVAYITAELTKKDKYKKFCSLSVDYNGHEYMQESYKWFIRGKNEIWEAKRPVKCQLWNCSLNLKKLKFSVYSYDDNIVKELHSIPKSAYFKIIKNDFFTIKFLKWSFWDKAPATLKARYQEVIAQASKYEPKIKRYQIESLYE